MVGHGRLDAGRARAEALPPWNPRVRGPGRAPPGPGPPGCVPAAAAAASAPALVPRWVKWALPLAAAGFIFRRAIASVVLTALAATLHFLGLNVHLPSVRFAWPWQTITAGTPPTPIGPVGAAEDRGHLPACPGPGQLQLRVHPQGVQEHRHLAVLVRQHVLRRGPRVGHRQPEPRPGLVDPGPGHYRLQVLSRPRGGQPGRVAVAMVLPPPQLPQSAHDVTIDNILSKPLDTQHSWTYPGFGLRRAAAATVR